MVVRGTPVNLNYDLPFKFTGKIDKVTIDLKSQDQGSAEGEKTAAKQAALAKGALVSPNSGPGPKKC